MELYLDDNNVIPTNGKEEWESIDQIHNGQRIEGTVQLVMIYRNTRSMVFESSHQKYKNKKEIVLMIPKVIQLRPLSIRHHQSVGWVDDKHIYELELKSPLLIMAIRGIIGRIFNQSKRAEGDYLSLLLALPIPQRDGYDRGSSIVVFIPHPS